MSLIYAGQLGVAFLAGLLLALCGLYMMSLRILPLAFFAWLFDIVYYGTVTLFLLMMIWLALAGSTLAFPFLFWLGFLSAWSSSMQLRAGGVGGGNDSRRH